MGVCTLCCFFWNHSRKSVKFKTFKENIDYVNYTNDVTYFIYVYCIRYCYCHHNLLSTTCHPYFFVKLHKKIYVILINHLYLNSWIYYF